MNQPQLLSAFEEQALAESLIAQMAYRREDADEGVAQMGVGGEATDVNGVSNETTGTVSSILIGKTMNNDDEDSPNTANDDSGAVDAHFPNSSAHGEVGNDDEQNQESEVDNDDSEDEDYNEEEQDPDEVAETDLQQQIIVEKKLITPFRRDGPKSTSCIWSKGIALVAEVDEDTIEEAKSRGVKQPDGLIKLRDTKYICICSACFKDKNKRLKNCLYKVNEWSAFNFIVHLTHKHREIADQVAKIDEDLKKKAKAAKNSVSKKRSSSEIVKASGSNKKVVEVKQKSLLDEYDLYTSDDSKDIIDGIHERVFKFIIHSGIPQHHHKNEELRELIQYCVSNGDKILTSDMSRLKLGKWKLGQI